MSLVTYDKDGAAGVVTLDSPANKNAISTELIDGISEGLRRAYDDDSVRYVVLTHTGNTFSAGADLNEQKSFGATPEKLQVQRGHELGELFRLMLTGEKPIVAAIRGHVRAGGMGIVGACDIALAGPTSTFGLTEVRIGVAPSVISAVLEKRTEPRLLTEMYLRGHTLTPGQAATAGVITRAVDNVDAALAAFDADLKKAAPQGLAVSKRLANRDVVANVEQRTPELAELSAELFMSAQAQAGMRAFLDKKAPPWVVD